MLLAHGLDSLSWEEFFHSYSQNHTVKSQVPQYIAFEPHRRALPIRCPRKVCQIYFRCKHRHLHRLHHHRPVELSPDFAEEDTSNAGIHTLVRRLFPVTGSKLPETVWKELGSTFHSSGTSPLRRQDSFANAPPAKCLKVTSVYLSFSVQAAFGPEACASILSNDGWSCLRRASAIAQSSASSRQCT